MVVVSEAVAVIVIEKISQTKHNQLNLAISNRIYIDQELERGERFLSRIDHDHDPDHDHDGRENAQRSADGKYGSIT